MSLADTTAATETSGTAAVVATGKSFVMCEVSVICASTAIEHTTTVGTDNITDTAMAGITVAATVPTPTTDGHMPSGTWVITTLSRLAVIRCVSGSTMGVAVGYGAASASATELEDLSVSEGLTSLPPF